MLDIQSAKSFLFLLNMTKNNSYIIPSREILPIYRTCCPYDTKNFIHPRLNLTSSTNQMKIKNIDTCCLNKLQVDCRIQCHKKKKTYDCQRKTDSIQSFPNTKRTISLLSSSRKQRKFDSNTNVNSYNYDLNTTTSEQTFSSIESKRQYIYETKSASMISFKSNSFFFILFIIRYTKSIKLTS